MESERVINVGNFHKLIGKKQKFRHSKLLDPIQNQVCFHGIGQGVLNVVLFDYSAHFAIQSLWISYANADAYLCMIICSKDSMSITDPAYSFGPQSAQPAKCHSNDVSLVADSGHIPSADWVP